MKSVTIRDKKSGDLLIKVLHRKDGSYDVIQRSDLRDIDIEIRDDENCKVYLPNRSSKATAQTDPVRSGSGKR